MIFLHIPGETRKAMDLMNRRILRLAIPNIISNITIPLLGMVDTAIAGRLGDGAAAIGAIGIGTTIFNMIYWTCGFLRMGTSGITAQAYGARNLRECTDILVRSMSVAIVLALLLVLLRNPVGRFSLGLMQGSEGARALAAEYFFARIWAAPASISLFAIHGWFIGMQNSKTPMVVSIISNVVNVVFSALFVFRFDMGIAGVAWGTVVAQYTGVAVSWIFWGVYYGRLAKYADLRRSIRLKPMTQFFHINKDIFLRTLCLVTAYTFFTAASSRFGDTVLATNTLLMQLFTLFSYMSDGFAYAAESLAGKYIGAGNRPAPAGGYPQALRVEPRHSRSLRRRLPDRVAQHPLPLQPLRSDTRYGWRLHRMGYRHSARGMPALPDRRHPARCDTDENTAKHHVHRHRPLFRTLLLHRRSDRQ